MMVKKNDRVSNLQCFCKRIVNDKARPDIKGFSCKCSGFGEKTGVEQIINVERFVVVNKKS